MGAMAATNATVAAAAAVAGAIAMAVAVVAAAVEAAFCGAFERGFEFVTWLFGIEQHGAAGDVAAEENALRSAQHFDRFKIEDVQHDAAIDAEVNAVDENAHGRIDGRDG